MSEDGAVKGLQEKDPVRRTHLGFGLVSAFLLGLSWFMPANATGTWTVPGTPLVSGVAIDPSPVVTASAEGTLWVAYTTGNGVVVTSNRTGTWSTPTQLGSGTIGEPPVMSIAPNGDAAVVWRETADYTHVKVAKFIGGVWQSPESLEAGGNVVSNGVAVTPTGRIVVVSTLGNGAVVAIVGSMTGTFDVPLSVSSNGFGAFDVKADATGRVTIAWTQENTKIMARTIEPGSSSLSTAQQISANGESSADPKIATNASGDTVITMTSLAQPRIARRLAGAALFDPVVGPSSLDTDAIGVRAAVAPDGSAAIVWNYYTGSSQSVRLARLGVDGAVSPSAELTPQVSPGYNMNPSVTLFADGSLTIAWVQRDQSFMPGWWTGSIAPGGSSFTNSAAVVAPDSSNLSWTAPVLDTRGSLWTVQTSQTITGYLPDPFPGPGPGPFPFGLGPAQIPIYSYSMQALTDGSGVPWVATTTTTTSTTTSTTTTTTSTTTSTTLADVTTDPPATTKALDAEPVVPAFTG